MPMGAKFALGGLPANLNSSDSVRELVDACLHFLARLRPGRKKDTCHLLGDTRTARFGTSFPVTHVTGSDRRPPARSHTTGRRDGGWRCVAVTPSQLEGLVIPLLGAMRGESSCRMPRKDSGRGPRVRGGVPPVPHLLPS